MTMPNPATVERLLTAAGDRDAVRAAYLMADTYQSDGTTVFTKQSLAALWSAQFPGDAPPPVGSRVNKGMQSLGRTVAVIRDVSTYTVGDTAILAWLGTRNVMITGTGPVELPVSADDVTAVEQLVTDRGDVVPIPDGDPSGDVAPV